MGNNDKTETIETICGEEEADQVICLSAELRWGNLELAG